MRRTLCAVAGAIAACVGILTFATGPRLPAASGAGLPTVALSRLAGATTGTSFILTVDIAGATSAKLLVDQRFVGKDTSAPLSFPVSVTPGPHRLTIRAVIGGTESSTAVTFTAARSSSGGTPPVVTTAQPTTITSTVPTPPPPAPSAGEIVVSTVDQVRSALQTARPGTVIRMLDGEYQFKPRLVASTSGRPGAPVTLRGSRRAVIRTKNAAGDYGLHITGDYWRIEGLTVAHATKGIVLDGSVGTVIDGVQVFDIGDEAVHFRSCSSDGVLRRSYIHHTGRNSPQYGEGVYVGSANSNWSSYRCTDRIENKDIGDNSERVNIEDNVFEDTTAEAVDLKEGTDSGSVRRNVFRRTGASGLNSADSAVDAKGNNWVIEDNVVLEAMASWSDDGVLRPSKFTDSYQSHSVYAGYGTGNRFLRNRVDGSVPGFGVGMYPAAANVATCTNSAPRAAKGLVGDNGRSVSCAP